MQSTSIKYTHWSMGAEYMNQIYTLEHGCRVHQSNIHTGAWVQSTSVDYSHWSMGVEYINRIYTLEHGCRVHQSNIKHWSVGAEYISRINSMIDRLLNM